ncbi:MlaA family lipoprotein [Saccharospirillum salsuginis]|uniref:Phospholipid-binding lipoprotein MlaA n=1 Tax=Saccharospirillum salsuginis TaxID=418750 RepID=A0A918K5T9_9GAMM|nr:VacJ family lipoprotein [Saccharospirillum salsuginis]GGX50899.1 hypothetical protein GCM10007392_17630 [Saccharospirillum salsuginis]
MLKWTQFPRRLLVVCIVLSSPVGFNAAWAASDKDPLEPVNRAVFVFNDAIDQAVLKPVSEVYTQFTPDPFERGVRNFFGNIGEVRNATNNLFQGKWKATLSSSGRFMINTTVGIGGLFDVATKIGLPVEREDFGQTLGRWGVPTGPYLVVPIVGPSTLRDGSGTLADVWLSPLQYTELNVLERGGLAALDGIQTRADLLASEGLLSGDKYLVIREAYLSKREYDVQDGQSLSDSFIDSTDRKEDVDEEGFVDESF